MLDMMKGGEPKGNMWCDRLGNWIVAEQKGWRLDFDND